MTRMDSSFQVLTRAGHPWRGYFVMGLVDAGRTPPTVGCRTRETEWGERRRSSAQGDSSGNRLRGNCYEGSGCPTTSSQASAWEKDAACPGWILQWGSCETGSDQPACNGRPAHGRKTQLAQGAKRPWGKLRDVKRPACFQRQTGACRSCGSAACQPCRGREEPVETTDAFRPTGGGRGAESGPSLSPTARATDSQPPDQRPASEAINSDSPDRCPVTEAINFQPPDGCQAGEGLITPTAGLGPRTKDQRQLRRFDPRCLRRAYHSASAAFPLGRPGESESSSGHARATGITHPGFLWSETLEKA